ncbi:hypothetical protein [Bosea sp. (in: a-proteobacteria)]|uniref:hypothetical protein n=1 Tax=Bosea sp. (in: a-proteobacteria) TaxID=1871050 RepID=UPI00333ECC7B
MAKRSTASRRIGLMGLAVAGALAGSAGGAAAQYYYYDDDYYAVPAVPYPPAYGYGYGYRYAPRIAEPVTAYDIRRIASQTYGFVRIDRLYRSADTYVVDGMRANGQRQRLILDAFAGNLIRRIPLRGAQAGQGPDIARIDPQQEREPPRPRLVPQPPQRPAEFAPPAAASAPATVTPPAPAAPEKAPAPPPAPQPPVEANAPATQEAPPSPTTPAAPEKAPSPQAAPQPPVEASAPATQEAPPAAAAPAPPSPGSAPEKPRLVNPQDVRGIDETERRPPLATRPPASAEAAVPLAPVQGQDSGPAKPRPETPIVPVAPLD